MESRDVTFNGLALHRESGLGANGASVTHVDGIGGAPRRGASGDRASADGSWFGTQYRSARAITIQGVTESPDAIASELWRDRLDQACHGKDLPLTLGWASGDRTALVRLDGAVKVDRITPEFLEWQIPLIADDPSVYAGDGVNPTWSGSTGRASESGGVIFPLGLPLLWDSRVVGGELAFRNPGTTGRLQLRLDGPLTDPVVTTVNADGTRVLSWPITLAAGEFLLVDPGRRRAMLQGQASRPPAQRGWPRLTPALNTFRLHASGSSSSGSLSVYAWAAY